MHLLKTEVIIGQLLYVADVTGWWSILKFRNMICQVAGLGVAIPKWGLTHSHRSNRPVLVTTLSVLVSISRDILFNQPINGLVYTWFVAIKHGISLRNPAECVPSTKSWVSRECHWVFPTNSSAVPRHFATARPDQTWHLEKVYDSGGWFQSWNSNDGHPRII